ncbi:MAG: hypothetical protein ACPGUV_01230, partial [Polyangiales bacterium]
RFEQGYLATLVPGAALTHLRIHHLQRPDKPLELHYRAKLHTTLRRTGARGAELTALFRTRLLQRFAQLPERAYPLLIRAPIDLHLHLRVKPPPGMALQRKRRRTTRREGHYQLKQDLRVDHQGHLHLRRHLHVPFGRITPAHYPRFAAFCRQVDTLEGAAIPLRWQ